MTAIVATSSRLRIIYSALSPAAVIIAPAFDAIVWPRRVGSTVGDRPGQTAAAAHEPHLSSVSQV
jgi:hypothetical protein